MPAQNQELENKNKVELSVILLSKVNPLTIINYFGFFMHALKKFQIESSLYMFF